MKNYLLVDYKSFLSFLWKKSVVSKKLSTEYLKQIGFVNYDNFNIEKVLVGMI